MKKIERAYREYIKVAEMTNNHIFDIEYDSKKDIAYLTGIKLNEVPASNYYRECIIEVPEFITQYKYVEEHPFMYTSNYEEDSDIDDSLNMKYLHIKLIWHSFNGRNMYRMFRKLRVYEFVLDMPLNRVETMREAFSFGSYDTIELKYKQVPKLKDIEGIFYTCSVNNNDFIKLDLSSVVNMNRAFERYTFLSQNSIKLKVRDVKFMAETFCLCNVEKLDLSESDLSNLVSAKAMFYNSNISDIDLGDNTEFSNLENAIYLFGRCLKLKKIRFNSDVISFPKLKSTRKMFYMTWFKASRLLVNEKKSIKEIYIPNLESCNSMFYGCNDIKKLDLSKIKVDQTEKKINIKNMFSSYLNGEKTLDKMKNLKILKWFTLPDERFTGFKEEKSIEKNEHKEKEKNEHTKRYIQYF